MKKLELWKKTEETNIFLHFSYFWEMCLSNETELKGKFQEPLGWFAQSFHCI
jgi:hypothetical protein